MLLTEPGEVFKKPGRWPNMVTFHQYAFRHQYYVLLPTCDSVFPALFSTTTQKKVPSHCSQQAQLMPSANPPPAVHVSNFTNTWPRPSGPPGSLVPNRTGKAPGAVGQSQGGSGHADGRASARPTGCPGCRRASGPTPRPPHPAPPAAAPRCRAARCRSPQRPPSRGAPHPVSPEPQPLPARRSGPGPRICPSRGPSPHRTAAAGGRPTSPRRSRPLPRARPTAPRTSSPRRYGNLN